MNGRDTNDLWLEVAAQPGPFRFPLRRSAIIMIDMQRDFILPGGFGATLGNDVAQLAGAVPVARRLLDWGRARGLLIVHTREAHAADLSDCPPAKRNRGNPALRIGDIGAMGRILIDGEEGSDFVPELAPRAGEITLVKPGKGAFYATNLGEQLQTAGITHLILGGVTTEVCVQTTMREANDRGYECLLLEDCCGATDFGNHQAAIKMVKMQGGVFGAVAGSQSFIETIR